MKYEEIIALTENAKTVGAVYAGSENGVAYFKIVGRIWRWSADEGSKLRNAVDEAIAAGRTKAIIEGSSEGGSVFATNDLLALFQKFEDVKIKVDALMASAFTYLTSHFHTTIKSNTQGMIHMPMLGAQGNVKQIKSTLKLGENITKNYLKAYAKKTGKTEQDIQELWANGDYWMDAEELLAEGFVDAIEGEVKAFTEFDVAALASAGAPIVPKITKNKKDEYMNREELIAWLGLEASATDEQIKDAKDALKVDALKQRESVKPNTTPADGNSGSDEVTPEAKALVAKALKAKKISAKEVPTYETLATANLEATTKALDALQPIPNLKEHLNRTGDGADAKAKWTFEDYLENDPEALEALLVEDEAKYKALEAAYHAKL